MSTIKREVCDTSAMNRFYSSLTRSMSFLGKRSVSYFINIHTETSAVIGVRVTGKKGNASITCLVTREPIEKGSSDEEWVCAVNGKKFFISSLTDVGGILVSAIANLKTRVNTL